ncbi:MAG: DUF222 domain-containing protein [Pseudonocardiaceae bacterium]
MIETQLDLRQAMVACLDQWRQAIVECDDARLPTQVRDIESVSRMVYSVMLDTVAELESRNIAVTAGFRSTKQLLAGMLNLSPTEAGTRVAYAEQLAPRRTLGGEMLAPLLPATAAALATGQIGPAQVKVITETINAIPAGVSTTDRDAAPASAPRPSTTQRTSARPKRDGGRVTRKTSRSSWVGNPIPSTSGGPCEPSHYPSAERWSREIAGVRFPAVTGHRDCARRIMLGTGLMVVKPRRQLRAVV